MSVLSLGFIKNISDYFTSKFKSVIMPYGKNLFNKDTVTIDAYIGSGGTVVTSGAAGFYCSDHIPVVGGSKIIANNMTSSAFIYTAYYKNGVFLSSITNADVVTAGKIFTVPQTATSMRISNLTSGISTATLQLEYGTSSTLYESFSPLPKLPDFRNALQIREPSGDSYYPHNFPVGKNLFNKTTVSLDKYIGASGNEVTGIGYYASAYIKVLPNAVIKLSKVSTSAFAGLGFYNESGLVSFLTDATILAADMLVTVPATATLMRISGQETTTSKNVFQVEYGFDKTEYADYQKLPTLPSFREAQEVFLSPVKSGFVEKEKIIFGSIELDTTTTKIIAIYENYVVYTGNNTTIYFTDKGIRDNYTLTNFDATLTVVISTDLPDFISGSTISRAVIFNSKNGIRTMLFTSKNQVYYSSGQSFGNFMLSNIWTLQGDEFKHKSISALDKDPSGTRYRFYPTSAIATRSTQYDWFNSILWLNSESPTATSVESLIFANYHTGTNATSVPSCVFQTEDGENIYIQYMFGIPCGSVKKAGTSTYVANGATGYGDDLNTSEIVNNYASGLTLKKRTSIIPSAAESDPTDIFEILAPVNITAFTKANPAVATVSSASGIVAGNVVFIDGDALDLEWNALRNTTASVTSGGNGLFYVVKSVAGNNITLAESIGNPNNNLIPRHIHSLNWFANGVAIGTGEVYPQSYLIFNRIHRDATSADWRKNTILTTSENALQRTIGVYLRKDNKLLFSSDEMWLEKEIDNLIVRGTPLTSTVAGVWKGSLADIDDASKFDNVLWNIDPCYKFVELTAGILLCVTNSGKTYLSYDDGDTWEFVTIDGNWKNHTIGFDKNRSRFFFNKNTFVEIK